MSEKLKPCPFCGREAFLYTIDPHEHLFVNLPAYGGGAFVECTNCTCIISADTKEEACKAWNTRKPMEDIIKNLELKAKYFSIFECDMYNASSGFYEAIEIVKSEINA